MGTTQDTLPDSAEVAQLLRASDAPADRIALQCAQGALTYDALLTQARTLAAALHTRCGEAPHIGVAMTRGPDAFVAMLAILLAGGKCVPIDTSYPLAYQRRAFATAGCTLVLTDAPTDAFECPAHAFDTLAEARAARPLDQPRAGAPGFVLFTSGTTGTPKGVVLELAALIAATRSFGARTQVGAGSVVAQYAGLSFDASVLEFLLAFVHRATLNIVSAAARVEPETLAQELETAAVTHLILPAAVAPYLPLRKSYALQAIIFVGDTLEERVFHDWAAIYPTFNGYGPTEGAICTSLHRVTPGAPVDLGTPLDHVRVRIGGKEDRELLIGGPGIATGYIQNAAQTSARFRPDAEGSVWYHSGDRVRQDPQTGALRFAGRFDFQAKVNGTRIETLALESTLVAVAGIEAAAVLACPGPDGQKFLAAFVASQGAPKTVEAAARTAISDTFPAGHMPSVFTVLPRLPLTRNQKIDRNALLEALGQPNAHLGDDPARAAFLAELRRPDCDETANFFHEGGNSIGAMRLLSALEAQTGRHVAVKDFRAAPTIAGLRALLDEGRDAPIEIMRHQRSGDELPLSVQQNTAWYLHRQDPQSKAYLAEAVHHFSGPLDIDALHDALQDLFDAHEIYRTTFHDRAGVPVQRIHPAHAVSFPRIDAAGTAPEDRETVLQDIIDKHLPGIPDLGKLPLANFALVSFGETEHAFIHQEHHIVHDGWGGSAFTAELLNRYHKRVDPAFDYTLPQPAQYSDFLLTQQAWLTSPAAQAQIDYWRDQLDGAPQSVAIFGKASTAPGFAGGTYGSIFRVRSGARARPPARAWGSRPLPLPPPC
ncbi:AMP-binding protein [Sulfitobacter albidus]|uniref:AMP-binding protein n=1 Tax=Sulfitobacter albidus TaxID=2829501 RepID=UPI0020C8EA46|nr:AMP-binding protein [Sulfitobacter albidus]